MKKQHAKLLEDLIAKQRAIEVVVPFFEEAAKALLKCPEVSKHTKPALIWDYVLDNVDFKAIIQGARDA